MTAISGDSSVFGRNAVTGAENAMLSLRDGVPAVGGAEHTGGFTLSRDEAQALLRRIDRILAELREIKTDASVLKTLAPPADDPVSRDFNDALAGHGRTTGALIYAVGHVDHEISYLRQFKHRLEDALGSTERTDEHNGTLLPKQPDPDDGGSFG